MGLKEKIREHSLTSRVSLYDKIKWITPREELKRYGKDISDVQREIIMQNADLMYPTTE